MNGYCDSIEFLPASFSQETLGSRADLNRGESQWSHCETVSSLVSGAWMKFLQVWRLPCRAAVAVVEPSLCTNVDHFNFCFLNKTWVNILCHSRFLDWNVLYVRYVWFLITSAGQRQPESVVWEARCILLFGFHEWRQATIIGSGSLDRPGLQLHTASVKVFVDSFLFSLNLRALLFFKLLFFLALLIRPAFCPWKKFVFLTVHCSRGCWSI